MISITFFVKQIFHRQRWPFTRDFHKKSNLQFDFIRKILFLCVNVCGHGSSLSGAVAASPLPGYPALPGAVQAAQAAALHQLASAQHGKKRGREAGEELLLVLSPHHPLTPLSPLTVLFIKFAIVNIRLLSVFACGPSGSILRQALHCSRL